MVRLIGLAGLFGGFVGGLVGFAGLFRLLGLCRFLLLLLRLAPDARPGGVAVPDTHHHLEN